MQVLHPRCCGIDVHKERLAACVRVQAGRRAKVEVRLFGTTTSDLLSLGEWLVGEGCTHVAMESTSVYWKPVFNILEGQFEVILANARHIRAVPGRKTDVRDCEWIADLLAHGLVRPSFIPPAPIRELRDLTRYRKCLSRQRVEEANRVHKLLEDANIKLGNVASDVLGVSGRAMLAALINGQTDEHELAALAKGALCSKKQRLSEALRGRFTPHHGFILTQLLGHIDYIAEATAVCDSRIATLVAPLAEELERLRTIPGIGPRTAQVLVSEIGVDMSRFPSAGHLASWAKICPGSNESAGKRRPSKTGLGNNWLRAALIESAWAASRSRKTYLGAQFRRIAARRGAKRGIVAIAHSILVAVWHVLARRVDYVDLGPDYFDRANQVRLRRYHLRRLAELGVPWPVEVPMPG